MAITVEKGKKFQRINLGATGGDFAMSQEYLIREIRLTEHCRRRLHDFL